jgi:Avidin family
MSVITISSLYQVAAATEVINFLIGACMPIDGKWVNELGSTMEFKLAADGSISGTYQSSKAGDDANAEPLKGLKRAGKSGTYIGWTVCYSSTKEPDKDPAVCSWSGHYFEASGVEKIETTWILTVASDEIGKWDNTLLGKNTFTRSHA